MLLTSFQPGLDLHHIAVGLVLGKRQVQQVVGAFAGVGPDQVGGHVVGGPERGVEMKRAARGERGDLVKGYERAPQHHRVAQLVDATAPSPTGELGVLARREKRMMVARELGQLLDHHALGGHVDAHRKRLGGEHHLHQALHEAGLDHLLEWWNHAGMMRGNSRFELRQELAVAKYRQICWGNATETGVDDLANPVAVVAGREADARGKHRTCRHVALVAAEDEVDRRQHLVAVEHVDHVEA